MAGLNPTYPLMQVTHPFFEQIVDPVNNQPAKTGEIHSDLRSLNDSPGYWSFKDDLTCVDVSADLSGVRVASEELIGERDCSGLPLYSVERAGVKCELVDVAGVVVRGC